MDAIENAAFVSVGRACGFAGLAIFCIIFGLSIEPLLAARAGGVLCLFVTLILVFCALRAPTRPYKRTEVWMILAKDDRPPADIAQQVIGETLQRTYSWFAQQSAVVTLVMMVIALVLKVFVY